MTSEKNHIGQNFDSFLKEENIEISEEEIRKKLEKEGLKIYIDPAYGEDKSCEIRYKVIDGKIYVKDCKIFESEEEK